MGTQAEISRLRRRVAELEDDRDQDEDDMSEANFDQASGNSDGNDPQPISNQPRKKKNNKKNKWTAKPTPKSVRQLQVVAENDLAPSGYFSPKAPQKGSRVVTKLADNLVCVDAFGQTSVVESGVFLAHHVHVPGVLGTVSEKT